MELEETRRNWEQFGREDPLWAILTYPDRKNNRWEINEFFATGRREIDQILRRLSELDVDFAHNRCLDFGCGVGRLTQALCESFDHCDGVDIAESMIEQANRLNRHPERCLYHVNTASDLGLFEDASFDFIYATAVLQHMEPRYCKRYIAEFVRLLTPRGVAVFEVPVSYTRLGRLPDGSHQAAIAVVSATPPVMEPAESCSITAQVRNLGKARWPWLGSPYPIQLGNHWLTADASTAVTWADGRGAVSSIVEPGGSAVFTIEVTAPDRPGDYVLELDMVEEGVTWFAERGSKSLRIPVKVKRPAYATRLWRRVLQTGSCPDPIRKLHDEPVMEMHCVPQQDVLAVVEGSGGQAVDVEEYDPYGDGHSFCRYVVTASSGRS